MTMICDAIRDREVITFFYDGQVRAVEPYCHGTTKTGNEVLRAYQLEGGTQSGNPSPWRLFSVNKIASIALRGERFLTIRADYNPQDRSMTTIHCSV